MGSSISRIELLKWVRKRLETAQSELSGFRMVQAGVTVKVLEPVIGRKSRVYEILSDIRTTGGYRRGTIAGFSIRLY
jgi:hypothetical protein